MQLDDLLGDGQSQAVTPGTVTTARTVCPVEPIKNSRQVGGGYALALISDFDFQ